MTQKLALTQFPVVRYTLMEYHLFDILKDYGTRVTTNKIADARRKLGNWDVAFPLNTISTTMSRLIDKVEINKEKFKICKDGKRPGHLEVEYWIERKKKKKKKKPVQQPALVNVQ
jgi:hypothetical protein